MGTIAEKLSYLNGTKNVLKTNLINKSVVLTGNETFRELANKVNDIQAGGGKVSPDYVSFYGYMGTSLDLSWLDTSNITFMRNMFSYCSSLTSLDVSHFDTSNVTTMLGMFSSCSYLTSLDVSNFDTSNLVDMTSMFKDCTSLTSLDVSNFNTSNVTVMTGMFRGCTSLTSLNISSFNTSKVAEAPNMFYRCSSLTSIVGILDMQKVTSANNMFSSCSALEEVHIHNLGVNLSLSNSSKLTHDCLVELINNLQTVTSTKTLTLGLTNLEKLTDAEKQVATNKGWTLA